MINKSIREKRNQLNKKSQALQYMSLWERDFEKGRKLKEKQNDIYKKWLFFDRFIKAIDKIG